MKKSMLFYIAFSLVFVLALPISVIQAKSKKSKKSKNRGSNKPRNNTKASNKPRNNTKGSNKPRNNTKGSNKPKSNTKGSNRPKNNTKASNKPKSNIKGSNKPGNKNKVSNKPKSNIKGSNRPGNRNRQENSSQSNQKTDAALTRFIADHSKIVKMAEDIKKDLQGKIKGGIIRRAKQMKSNGEVGSLVENQRKKVKKIVNTINNFSRIEIKDPVLNRLRSAFKSSTINYLEAIPAILNKASQAFKVAKNIKEKQEQYR